MIHIHQWKTEPEDVGELSSRIHFWTSDEWNNNPVPEAAITHPHGWASRYLVCTKCKKTKEQWRFGDPPEANVEEDK